MLSPKPSLSYYAPVFKYCSLNFFIYQNVSLFFMKQTKILQKVLLKKFLFLGFFMIMTIDLFGQDPLYQTNSNLPCIRRTFHPHVFIILDSLQNPVISTQEMTQYFEKLNQAFEPICISFSPCNISYVKDYSFEIISDTIEINALASRNQKKRRINIYFTGFVFSENINSFSMFNGITNDRGALIIVPKTGIGLIHEMGHTFGLYHTFENKFGREKVDQSNCATAGDMICDTPAMPAGVFKNKDCEYVSILKDSDDAFYKPEIGNYMSHYFCAHCFFSREQYIKMAENYLSSPFKMW